MGKATEDNLPSRPDEATAKASPAVNRLSHPLRVMLGFLPVFVIFLVLLFGFRLLFAAVFAALLQGTPAGAVAGALLRGLRFDAAGAGLLALPALPLYLLGAAWRPVLCRRLIQGYLALALTACCACALGDLQYFEESGKHLTYEALAYLDLTSLPVFAGAFKLHPWASGGSLLVTFGAGCGAYAGFGRLLRRPLAQQGPRLSRAAALTLLALGGSALFLVSRGGAQRHPLGVGDASFSPNPYLNALSLSPVFSALRTALTGEHETFRFASDPANIAAVRRLLEIAPQPGQTDQFPLARTAPGSAAGNRKNVVLFLLESWSGKDIGCLGATTHATPVFDALARDGILFTNFYANGIRTAEGLVSTLCSFPNQPVLPVLKRPVAFQTRWRSLSQILADAGYTNSFIHGRDLDFDHVAAFLRLINFDQIIDRHNFPPSIPAASDAWPGYNDREVLRYADSLFARQTGKPFFSVIYLMNTHPPFMTPSDFPLLIKKPRKIAQRFLNSLRYSDDSLGTFFECARRNPYFKDTIFVFVADHARTGDKFTLANQHHIPLLLYSPGFLKPAVRAAVGSQTDILPTVLGLLGLGARHASWGRDLLAVPEDQGFAICVAGNDIRWRDHHNLLNDTLAARSPQLFDLARDPACQADRADDEGGLRDRLQGDVRSWLSLSQTILYQNRVTP